jgi:hypothetical protein
MQAQDRNLPFTNVWPIGQAISQALWSARFVASLLAIFVLLGLVLCEVSRRRVQIP